MLLALELAQWWMIFSLMAYCAYLTRAHNRLVRGALDHINNEADS